MPDSIREPVRKPWIWVVVAAIVLVGVPLYFPEGDIDPLWFGVPYWLIVSVLSAVALSALISYVCLRWWNLAEPQETARADQSAEEDDR